MPRNLAVDLTLGRTQLRMHQPGPQMLVECELRLGIVGRSVDILEMGQVGGILGNELQRRMDVPVITIVWRPIGRAYLGKGFHIPFRRFSCGMIPDPDKAVRLGGRPTAAWLFHLRRN